MARVKWIASEFTPNENQVGMGHSWSALIIEFASIFLFS